MKKQIILFLCIVLAVTAVGCDTKDTDQPSASVSQSASEVPSGDDTVNLPSTDSEKKPQGDHSYNDPYDDSYNHISSTTGQSSTAACDHIYGDASCTAPKTCYFCNATEGSPLGHNWKEATHAQPKTCSRCGQTEGAKLTREEPNVTVDVSFPATFSHYSRTFTMTSCQARCYYSIDHYYMEIEADITRKNDSSPDSDRGLLSLYVVVKDENGRLICDNNTVASNKLAKNEQGLFQGTFGLPVDANAKSYTISFRER